MSDAPVVHASFYEDLKTAFAERLRKVGYAIDPSHDHTQVGMRFFNVMKRMIFPAPRRVHWSQELLARHLAIDEALARTLAQIEADSLAGGDLNARLSKHLLSVDYFDPMLNDWGLHHLHLGTNLIPSGFVERSGPLLYALIRPTDFYFVDVRSHGHWSDLELFEIVHRNWPEEIRRFRLNGISPSSTPYTDQERSALRKAGVSAFTQTADGTLYIPPGGGISTAGSSMHALVESDRAYNDAKDWEELCREKAAKILDCVNGRSSAAVTELQLELKLDFRGKLFVAEKQTGITFFADQLRDL